MHVDESDGDDNDNDSFDLDAAYAVETPDDNRQLYKSWAATYDTGFVDKNKYSYPKRITEICAASVSATDVLRVIDIGCGTGVVGVRLSELLPHAVIDGADISAEMLHIALSKLRSDGSPVYGELGEVDLTLPITFARSRYDILISAGTFTHGHLGPDALIAVVSTLKPGGQAFVGINKQHFVANDFERALQRAVAAQLITEPTFIEIQMYDEGSAHFGDVAMVALFRRSVSGS
ncbi:MAG: class I SAM-dependent methyltransferase [Actinomycetota bacterium]